MGTISLAQSFVEHKTADANWQDRLCPDCAIKEMCWYWGFCPVTGLEMWFWVGPGTKSRTMPNYLADERPAPVLGPVFPNDTRQGISYHLDRGF